VDINNALCAKESQIYLDLVRERHADILLLIIHAGKPHLVFSSVCLQMRLHSKKCWIVSNQIWVKYGQAQMLG